MADEEYDDNAADGEEVPQEQTMEGVEPGEEGE